MRDRRLSRRAFLRTSLLGGSGLAAAYVLGCSNGNDGGSAPTARAPLPSAVAGTPRPSGALAWTQRAATGPSPRRDHSLTSDGDRLYLFGGRDGDGTLGDFWRYDIAADEWTMLSPEGAPAVPPAFAYPGPRFGQNAVWHKQSSRLIVFGGQTPDGFVNDLWAFDPAAGAWSQLDAGSGPSPRYGAASAVTSEGLLIITHGFTDTGRFDDSWRYDAGTGAWTDISPAGQRPVERCLTRAVWTEVQDQHLLMFGGQTTADPFLDDFWALAEGRDWSEVVRVPQPGARNQYAMVYDSAGHRAVLFGGDSEAGPLNDVWWFDADDEFWSNPTIEGDSPPARYGHDAAWAAATGSTFVFGGSDGQSELADLWELGPAPA